MPISHNQFIRQLGSSVEYFPFIQEGNYKVTSAIDKGYNCLAWAADTTNKRWDPTADSSDAYWPPEAPREATKKAFIKAYSTLGYTICKDGRFRKGYIKIAAYFDPSTNELRHAARQLPNGKWSSKLGNFYDIEHDSTDVLQGPCYGQVMFYMSKKT